MKKENNLLELINWSQAELEYKLSSTQINQFQLYLRLLQEWNEKINLTSITDEQEIIEKHFIDSLTCLKIPIFWLHYRILDIGTGGGFPGIPIKIIRPDLNLTLIETIGKKVKFLEELIKQLKLENVTIAKDRAETLAQIPEYRGQFNIVISRALAKLPVACELCLPFVKQYSNYLAMLGEDSKEQSDSAKFAIKELGGNLQSIQENNSNHSIAVIEKLTLTPTKYPRKPGIPEKRPLSLKSH